MAGAMPNGPLQVVFSFDTTGSMSSALTEVRGRLSDMMQRLQADIPHVTTAVVAHGDYCDRDIYITKHLDFTSSLPQLVDFVNNVATTGGGDEPEAYEVMLRLVRKDLAWVPGTRRVLVVIGDAFPHPPGDKQNKDKIDWKKETKLLKDMGVRIYGVQVRESHEATHFFKTMTETTDGQHLKLSQFGTLCDVIMAICYRERGAEFLSNYEAEVRAREGRKALHKDLEGVFGVLRRTESSALSAGARPAHSLSLAPKLPKDPSTLSKVIKVTSSKVKTKAASTKIIAAKKLLTRATPAAAKPKTLKLSRSRKLIREKVPDTNFRFRGLRWSSWKLSLIPAERKLAPTDQWRRVLRGMALGRTGAVVPTKQGTVLCEAAVQTRPGGRRHVVWCRVLQARSAQRLSVTRLLASAGVRAQLLRAMRTGCRLWVRWASVSGRQGQAEVKQALRDVYDYAWCHGSGSQRDVWVPNGSPTRRLQIAGAEPMVH